jgi:signal transduction histidine kinase
MQERAVILGGRLEVETKFGGGTTVRAILPKEQLI